MLSAVSELDCPRDLTVALHLPRVAGSGSGPELWRQGDGPFESTGIGTAETTGLMMIEIVVFG
jgi:hypothetical protein